MALRQEHQTKVNDRVRIKSELTHMYPKARVYNEAIVKGRRHDNHGYPLIYIEWDKDHWAYSGEEDRWVMEAHFDLVEEEPVGEEESNDSELLKALADLVTSFQDGRQERLKEPDVDPPNEDPRPDRELTYDEVLSKAMDDARDGDAFIVLVAHPDTFDGTELIVPHIYMHEKREDARLLLEATMADAAAQAHARMTIRLIERAKRESDGQTGS